LPSSYNLGNALLQKGLVDEAIAHFQRALKSSRIRRRLGRLDHMAWLLATSPEASCATGQALPWPGNWTGFPEKIRPCSTRWPPPMPRTGNFPRRLTPLNGFALALSQNNPALAIPCASRSVAPGRFPARSAPPTEALDPINLEPACARMA